MFPLFSNSPFKGMVVPTIASPMNDCESKGEHPKVSGFQGLGSMGNPSPRALHVVKAWQSQ